MYVFLCPLRKDESPSPPIATLAYFLFNALAIDYPKLVLPTPGGPTRHNIFP